MNRIISRLLTLLAALLMLTSVAACKQYPGRIDFKGDPMYHRWPTEFGEISLNKVKIWVLGHGTASIDLPPSRDKEIVSIKASWVEIYSHRSFEVSLDIPIKKVLGTGAFSDEIIVELLIGMHGEVVIMGPTQGSYKKMEILRLCGTRTPNDDKEFTGILEDLNGDTNFNDPKRLALPLPDSSCPDPGY